MYISHKRNCAYGRKKWSDAHRPKVEKPTIGKGVRAGVSEGGSPQILVSMTR
jgi:hypothetical protein